MRTDYRFNGYYLILETNAKNKVEFTLEDELGGYQRIGLEGTPEELEKVANWILSYLNNQFGLKG